MSLNPTLAIILLSIISLYGLGFNILKEDFSVLKNKKKSLFFAVSFNFFLLPLLCILFQKIFVSDLDSRDGIFLCSLSSGGASGALFILRSRGNAVFGASLMGILNFLNSLIAPVLYGLYKGESGIDLLLMKKIFMSGFLFQILPLLIGFIQRNYFPFKVPYTIILVRKLGGLILLITIFILIIGNYQKFQIIPYSVFLISGILNFIAAVSGLVLVSEELEFQSAISSVTIVRSLSLALLLSDLSSGSEMSKLSILIYGIFMYATGFLFSYLIKKEA
jgi:bile acid:Na+ symporter, BASS family